MSQLVPRPDRRQFGRKPSHIRGTIRLADGTDRACLVENYSASGALLIVESSKRLPRTFRLTIGRTGLRTDCLVVRRDGNAHGVAFQVAERDADAGKPGKRHLLTYDQLLSLASADRLQEEFQDRYGLALLKDDMLTKRPETTAHR